MMMLTFKKILLLLTVFTLLSFIFTREYLFSDYFVVNANNENVESGVTTIPNTEQENKESQSSQNQNSSESIEQNLESQQKSVFEISPILNQLVLDPGEKKPYSVTVRNLSSIPIPVKAYTRAFVASDEFGEIDFIDIRDDPSSVQNWFKIEKPDFIIQPFENLTLDMVIEVPEVIRAGGHYATLFFESLVPEDVLSSNSIYLSTRIGALFFFVISGDIVESGEIETFSVGTNFFQKGPVKIDFAFRNTGNIDLTPKTRFLIKDFRGEIVHVIEDDGKRTLPERIRRWELIWDKEWLFGKYTIVSETFLKEDVLNELSRPITKEIEFYAFPVLEGGISIVGFTIFFYIFILKRKNLKTFGKVLVSKDYKSQVQPYFSFDYDDLKKASKVQDKVRFPKIYNNLKNNHEKPIRMQKQANPKNNKYNDKICFKTRIPSEDSKVSISIKIPKK